MGKPTDLRPIKQRVFEFALNGAAHVFFGVIDAAHFVSDLKLRLLARRKR